MVEVLFSDWLKTLCAFFHQRPQHMYPPTWAYSWMKGWIKAERERVRESEGEIKDGMCGTCKGQMKEGMLE